MQTVNLNFTRWYVPVLVVFAALAFPVPGSVRPVRAAAAAAPAAQEAKERPFELGRIIKVFATAPRYHSTEDGRWDYRTTIIFKNAEIAHDNFDTPALLKQLFPDQDTYKREEQRRFEILDAHWDVPIKDVDLDAK